MPGVNQLLNAVGITHWKPLLSMLLMPPVPFLLMALVAAVLLVRSRSRRALVALFAGLLLTWGSLTVAMGEWLHAHGMPDIP
ncbi:MAG: hypothetical protein IIZ92_16750, partial [Aquincola sp.]|nr:hypothetical protein [Aquincola sp.]